MQIDDHLANRPVNLLPDWPFGLNSSFLGQNSRQIVHFSSTANDVDLTDLLDLRLPDELEAEVHDQEDRNAEI